MRFLVSEVPLYSCSTAALPSPPVGGLVEVEGQGQGWGLGTNDAGSERLVIYCQTTSVSAAHATYCATCCTPCRPLIGAFSGWIRTPPPTTHDHDTRRHSTPAFVRPVSLMCRHGELTSLPNEELCCLLNGEVVRFPAPTPIAIQGDRDSARTDVYIYIYIYIYIYTYTYTSIYLSIYLSIYI